MNKIREVVNVTRWMFDEGNSILTFTNKEIQTSREKISNIMEYLNQATDFTWIVILSTKTFAWWP